MTENRHKITTCSISKKETLALLSLLTLFRLKQIYFYVYAIQKKRHGHRFIDNDVSMAEFIFYGKTCL